MACKTHELTNLIVGLEHRSIRSKREWSLSKTLIAEFRDYQILRPTIESRLAKFTSTTGVALGFFNRSPGSLEHFITYQPNTPSGADLGHNQC